MPNPRPVPQAGRNFQDAVGRWLCSQGQIVLNDRHRRGEPPLGPASRSAIEWLTASMTAIALVEFDGDFTPAGDRGTRSEARLDRERLIDDMPGRARWVLEHWDRRKIEGRQQGGRNGRRHPKWEPGVLSQWDHLPEPERRARAEAHGIGLSPGEWWTFGPGAS